MSVGVVLGLCQGLWVHWHTVAAPHTTAHLGPMTFHLDHRDALALVSDHNVGVAITCACHAHIWGYQPPIGETIPMRLHDEAFFLVAEHRHLEVGGNDKTHDTESSTISSPFSPGAIVGVECTKRGFVRKRVAPHWYCRPITW